MNASTTQFPVATDDAMTAIVTKVIEMVPMAATLDLQPVSVQPQTAVVSMPDNPAFRNHVGGPHAGALFTMAEGAAGSLLFGNFFDNLDELTPLITGATIEYYQLAMGDTYAVANMQPTPEELLAQFRAGTRPEWPVEVDIKTADGTVTAHMTATMTLAKRR